jgi:hypothetical protein
MRSSGRVPSAMEFLDMEKFTSILCLFVCLSHCSSRSNRLANWLCCSNRAASRRASRRAWLASREATLAFVSGSGCPPRRNVELTEPRWTRFLDARARVRPVGELNRGDSIPAEPGDGRVGKDCLVTPPAPVGAGVAPAPIAVEYSANLSAMIAVHWTRSTNNNNYDKSLIILLMS